MPQDGETRLFPGDDTHWIECRWSSAAGAWIDCRKVPKAQVAAGAQVRKLESLKKAELIAIIRSL